MQSSPQFLGNSPLSGFNKLLTRLNQLALDTGIEIAHWKNQAGVIKWYVRTEIDFHDNILWRAVLFFNIKGSLLCICIPYTIWEKKEGYVLKSSVSIYRFGAVDVTTIKEIIETIASMKIAQTV